MLWLKAMHIFFVIGWFAGIFYLPRIFVNLAMVEDETVYDHLLTMANKLYRFMMPLALLAVVLGFAMLFMNTSYYFSQGWMHAKLTLFVLILVYMHICGRYLKSFQRRENKRSHVFYRWFNEAPVLLLLSICILVVVRPF